MAIVDQYPYSAKKYLGQYPELPIGAETSPCFSLRHFPANLKWMICQDRLGTETRPIVDKRRTTVFVAQATIAAPPTFPPTTLFRWPTLTVCPLQISMFLSLQMALKSAEKNAVMSSARFYTPHYGVKTWRLYLDKLGTLILKPENELEISLCVLLCCALLWRLDCAHTWGHGTGMMKMMELLCSSVGISVVEPTMAGPVVKPAPAKM